MYLTTQRRAAQTAPDVYSNLHRLSRMMDEALGGAWNGGTLASAWTPSCDVFEDKENLKIVLELPGVSPEEVKISLENQVLTIQGEKKQVAEETSERWHRYERSYGSFERMFTLPSTVDVDRIDAKVENGVLTVTLPKSERSRPRQIEVKAGTAQKQINTAGTQQK
jgi:HSP20 family protein